MEANLRALITRYVTEAADLFAKGQNDAGSVKLNAANDIRKLLPVAPLAVAGGVPSWRQHIDWMWNGTGPCTKAECFFFVIEGGVGLGCGPGPGLCIQIPPGLGPFVKLRGPASPRDCCRNAQECARTLSRDLALIWLQAGQAHNQAARQDLAANKSSAIDYVLTLG
jgi:hypothetical protein